MERNIANQYKPGDENTQSVMAYGINALGVQHLVVLGHYGCGVRFGFPKEHKS
jgi:carbonic anhydrase